MQYLLMFSGNLQNNQGLMKFQYVVGMDSKLKFHGSQVTTWAASETTVNNIPTWVTNRNFHVSH